MDKVCAVEGYLEYAERMPVTGETAQNGIAQSEDWPSRYMSSVITDTALHILQWPKIQLTHKIILHMLVPSKKQCLINKTRAEWSQFSG
jgi:hypothetical protein